MVRGEHVHETRAMIGHQVPRIRAILTLAELGLLECRDMLAPDVIRHGFRLPEAEAFTGPPDHERQELQ